jgi:hypothetical protein
MIARDRELRSGEGVEEREAGPHVFIIVPEISSEEEDVFGATCLREVARESFRGAIPWFGELVMQVARDVDHSSLSRYE